MTTETEADALDSAPPILRTLTPEGLRNFILDSSEWSARTTRATPATRWSCDGRPPFERGRSGDALALAVVKTGPKTALQLRKLDELALVAPERVPRVLGRWEGGYAMEMLYPYVPSSQWPQMMELVLRTSMWSRPGCSSSEWRHELERTLNIRPPSWAHAESPRCVTHGDPTLCNVMVRRLGNTRSTIVVADPIVSERVPEIAEVDQAKIVQSLLGWEIMTGYQTRLVEWHMPRFLRSVDLGGSDIRVVAYWTGVHMARIVASEGTTASEKSWARTLHNEIMGALL